MKVKSRSLAENSMFKVLFAGFGQVSTAVADQIEDNPKPAVWDVTGYFRNVWMV